MARRVTKISLMVGLLAGAWAVFPPFTALWVDGALLLFGFAIGDVISVAKEE